MIFVGFITKNLVFYICLLKWISVEIFTEIICIEHLSISTCRNSEPFFAGTTFNYYRLDENLGVVL